MDAQLEATYEGPEAWQRRQLSVTMTNELFLGQFHRWIAEIREICVRASRERGAMQRWRTRHAAWPLDAELPPEGHDCPADRSFIKVRGKGSVFPLPIALCWLLASRYLILDVLGAGAERAGKSVRGRGSDRTAAFYSDLCHVQSARALGSRTICSELVFRLPGGTPPGTPLGKVCFKAAELAALESVIPGISSVATDRRRRTGSHPSKADPVRVSTGAMSSSKRLRAENGRLFDGSTTRERPGRPRRSPRSMIPEALDYPA